MKSSLVIDLASLPEEGKSYAGELDSTVFDLRPGDAVPSGPLRYDLHVQRFEGELLLTGKLEAAFEFTCVVTLKPFLKTILLEAVAISLEIGNSSQMDVSEALREEILIEFPSHPRCDEGDVPEPCEIDSRYLAVDKPDENGVTPAPREEGDSRWSALNDLTGLNDQT